MIIRLLLLLVALALALTTLPSSAASSASSPLRRGRRVTTPLQPSAGSSFDVQQWLQDATASWSENEAHGVVATTVVVDLSTRDGAGSRWFATAASKQKAHPGVSKTPTPQPTVVNGRTLFQMGSVTKTFTTLAAELVAEAGLWNMDDAISKHLPSHVASAVAPAVANITLRQLASHSSGLPRLPANLNGTLAQPYATYTVEKMYDFLVNVGHHPCPVQLYFCILGLEGTNGCLGPKNEYCYSNFGMGLLGALLVQVTGASSYDEVVRRYITNPSALAMPDTTQSLSSEQRSRVLYGLDVSGGYIKPWTFQDATAGAGALWTTADDLTTYVLAHLGIGNADGGNGGMNTTASSSLFRAIYRETMPVLTTTPQSPYPTTQKQQFGAGQQCEGWSTYSLRLQPAFDKNGAVGGYMAHVVWSRTQQRLVIAFANRNFIEQAQTLAPLVYKLLAGPPPVVVPALPPKFLTPPPPPPPPSRSSGQPIGIDYVTAAHVDSFTLESYTGTYYAVTNDRPLKITLLSGAKKKGIDTTRIGFQLAGQSVFPLTAVVNSDFNGHGISGNVGRQSVRFMYESADKTLTFEVYFAVQQQYGAARDRGYAHGTRVPGIAQRIDTVVLMQNGVDHYFYYVPPEHRK